MNVECIVKHDQLSLVPVQEGGMKERTLERYKDEPCRGKGGKALRRLLAGYVMGECWWLAK